MRYILFNTGEREFKLRMSIEHALILERYKNITPYNFITYAYNNEIDMEMTLYILKEALAPYKNEYDSIESVGDIADEYFDNGGDQYSLNGVHNAVFQEAGYYDAPEEENKKEDEVSSDDITMEKLSKDMLKVCLEAGMDENEFWDSTYREVINYMNAYRDRREIAFKDTITANLILGDLVGISVSRLFSKEAKYPSVLEMFPKLFGEEGEKMLKEQKEKELNERIKANMLAWGAHFKAKNNENKE